MLPFKPGASNAAHAHVRTLVNLALGLAREPGGSEGESRKGPMRCIRFVAASFLASVFAALAGSPAYADHETRNQVLSESGLEMWLVALVIGGVIVALALFAAAIVWWERRDAGAEEDTSP